MKQKKFKNINVKKIVLYILSIVAGMYAVLGLYSLIFQQNELSIDRYNFQQLEKAKPILESMPENMKKFQGLKEFNELFNVNIKPIENCYYVSNYNGSQKYIFGFQLQSLIYQLIYFGDYYASPKYDLPISNFCGGGPTCVDKSLMDFRYVISSSCRN